MTGAGAESREGGRRDLLRTVLTVAYFLLLLYFFFFSIDLMSAAFKMFGKLPGNVSPGQLGITLTL